MYSSERKNASVVGVYSFRKIRRAYFVPHTTGRHIPLNIRPNHHKMATLNTSVLVALNLQDSPAVS